MKKPFNSSIKLALESGILIFLTILSLLKTILKWLLFACSVLSVFGITFTGIFNETYNETLAAGVAALITIVYTVYLFIKLEL